ncbi:MAG: monovalent cation/H+ antiporter complex subunit F [Bacteroidales bacterium]|nr:monovalent cation/H+ antiporter complex subunit F [Bacteroidales bacterium]NLM93836.1 pH regulation protein F [Bacteroidales bacterium]
MEGFPILNLAVNLSFASLTISLFAGLYRLLTGPTLPDRMVVMDLIASLVIGLILTYIMLTGQTVFLNVAVVIALLVFMGNIAFAKYLKRRIE